MNVESIKERIIASSKILADSAVAIPIEEAEEATRRNSESEIKKSLEKRLKWMEYPFLLLWMKDGQKRTELGRAINPEVHSAFSPAVKIEVNSGKLVGRKLSLEFLISSNSLPKVLSLPASHTLKKGPNIIIPSIALKTDRFPQEDYSVSIAIPSGLIINSFNFPISNFLQNEGEQFNEVLENGMTLQSIIDLIEDWQK
ncbi:hypothetical protein A2V80_00575 [Candidatus Woesebacteria bacterium RBG_16_39_8b]|uniref:Uncharacterized protein n=1 Tax=Candidatus Woesebacteria bacterium RBG_16_39_8b TaxID=1802482 RepID=A0A1F7X887_9BACT|nr:MAG: hypothetical protein A2V80_00575 [Candidatus Woesebacteria bacterium RBG_16_39_8b]